MPEWSLRPGITRADSHRMDRESLKRMGSRWPVLLLLAAFLGGLLVGGLGGGSALAFLVAALVIGPTYVVQSRRRRRRSVAPSGRWLDRDAGEATDAAMVAFVNAIARHQTARLAVLAVSCALIAGLWLMAGRWWGLAGFILMAPGMIGVAAGLRRHRRRH